MPEKSGHHLRYTVQRIINQTGPHTGYVSENKWTKTQMCLNFEKGIFFWCALKVNLFRNQIVKLWILPKTEGMNSLLCTSMRRVFVRFLEEIKESKKAFRNYLTFKNHRHTPTNAFIMINLKTDSTFMCIYPLFNVDKKWPQCSMASF